jgi:hypothetical protein
MISGQIRAARGFLAWDRRDLAKKAVVTIYTIERIEALEAEGIEFTNDGDELGVKLRAKAKGKAKRS